MTSIERHGLYSVEADFDDYPEDLVSLKEGQTRGLYLSKPRPFSLLSELNIEQHLSKKCQTETRIWVLHGNDTKLLVNEALSLADQYPVYDTIKFFSSRKLAKICQRNPLAFDFLVVVDVPLTMAIDVCLKLQDVSPPKCFALCSRVSDKKQNMQIFEHLANLSFVYVAQV